MPLVSSVSDELMVAEATGKPVSAVKEPELQEPLCDVPNEVDQAPFAVGDVELIRLAGMRHDQEANALFDDRVILTTDATQEPMLDRLRAGKEVERLDSPTFSRLVNRHLVMSHQRRWPVPDLSVESMSLLTQAMQALSASLLEVFISADESVVSLSWGMEHRVVARLGGRLEIAAKPAGLSLAYERHEFGGRSLAWGSSAPLPSCMPKGVTDEQWRSLRDLVLQQSFGLILMAAPAGERWRAMQVVAALRHDLPVQMRPALQEWGSAASTQSILSEASRRVVVALVEAHDADVWMAVPDMVQQGWGALMHKLLLARVGVSSRARECLFCGSVHYAGDYVELVPGEGCPECLGTGAIGAVTLLDVEMLGEPRAILRRKQAESDARRGGWIV